ncbi:MAG: hypothetical protein PVH29_09375 [Candidatus Zixiibacteriota bacterium]
MRSRVIIVAGSILVAGMAFGAGSIISSFLSPVTSSPIGMCYNGGYIYHMSHTDGAVFKTTTTGSVVSSITGPSSGIGVHFTGTHYWTTTYSPGVAYYRDSSGSIISSFAGPANGYGITSDGTNLWYSSSRSGNYIWQLTTAGSVISSVEGPGTFNGGVDWDSRGYIWVANWPSSNGGIYRITTAGSVVESYSPVPAGTRPSGCAWDGTYVWYCDYTGKYVYQMDTELTSITPASVGKVKALFR